MARSLKLKNNDFWDSSGVVDGTTPLNTVLQNINEKLLARNVHTYAKDLSTNVTANSWQKINPEDFTLNLPQGTYRVLVSMAVSTTDINDGIAYLSPLVNEVEISNNIRSSAFLKSGGYKITLQCEGYITANGSTTFNARIYPTVNAQVVGVIIYVERII